MRVWEKLWGLSRLEAWSQLGSTNDRLRSLARDGAPAFTVVLADEQTTGRGRGGRRWISPAGQGLWLSVLLRLPEASVYRLAPLYLGLAVCRAVERVSGGLSLCLKWPNDVLMDGRKLAGVLCENDGGGMVVGGVGINVAAQLSDFPADVAGQAATLANAPGGVPSRGDLAGALIGEVRALFAKRPHGNPLEEIRARDCLRGREIEVNELRGVAAGIDEAGHLLLQVEGREPVAVVAGSVVVTSSNTGRQESG